MSHIDRGRRAALAVRIAAAVELESRPLPGADKHATQQRDAILSEAFLEADYAEGGEGQLDHRVREIAAKLEGRQIVGSGPAIDELRRRRDGLVQKLRTLDCTACATAEKVCSGTKVQDSHIVTSSGHCIKPLKDLVAYAEALAREIYEACDRTFCVPHLEFSTSDAQRDADRALLKDFGINGISETRGEKPSIMLEIKDGHFRWKTLCQTLYVLVHELVCHAYQGGAAANRPNADEKCSWSEGWMDRLAFELVRHWIGQSDPRVPEFLQRYAPAVDTHTVQFHERRYEASGTLTPLYQERRLSARQTFDDMKQAWSLQSQQHLPSHRVTRFSTKLNLCNVSGENREKIVTWLSVNTAGPGMRYERTLQACSEFLGHGDPGIFLERLDTIGSGRD
jgi:hypothetical protein